MLPSVGLVIFLITSYDQWIWFWPSPEQELDPVKTKSKRKREEVSWLVELLGEIHGQA